MEKIEVVKSYWDKRPCNLKHSKKQIGTKEYFNQVAEKKYFVESHLQSFADFEKWDGKKVLEIGCGLGGESINFARAGAEVTAFDLSEKSLELAKKRAEVFGLTDKIKFYQGNAERLCEIVPIEQYDLIWSFGVIHHSPHPEKIIKSIKPFMGPETELRIMLYHKYSWKVFWILVKFGKGAFWKLDKLIAQYSEAQLGCPVTYTYSEWAARKLLRGLKIKDIQIEHIFSYKFPEYKDNVYKKVWFFRWLPKKVFCWLEKKVGWHMCITATL
jgi:ubiquinone/menaquinone biosynthesis C-methylase UbiE